MAQPTELYRHDCAEYCVWQDAVGEGQAGLRECTLGVTCSRAKVAAEIRNARPCRDTGSRMVEGPDAEVGAQADCSRGTRSGRSW